MEKVISKDGTPIAFDRVGQGPAVILVDGALGHRSFSMHSALAALLASHFSVYTYDRRGRGDSGDTQPYTVECEVEDIQALIQHTGGPAFLYGISSGAALALRAAMSQLNIQKLALYEPPFILGNTRPNPGLNYLSRLKELVAEGRRGDAVEHFMVVGVGLSPEFVAPMREAPMWSQLEEVAPTLVYDGSIMADFSLPARLETSVHIPTLVIDGGESPEWMRHSAQELTKAIPHAQYRTLPGQTHEVSPAVLAPVLAEFFHA